MVGSTRLCNSTNVAIPCLPLYDSVQPLAWLAPVKGVFSEHEITLETVYFLTGKSFDCPFVWFSDHWKTHTGINQYNNKRQSGRIECNAACVSVRAYIQFFAICTDCRGNVISWCYLSDFAGKGKLLDSCYS